MSTFEKVYQVLALFNNVATTTKSAAFQCLIIIKKLYE